LPKTAKLSVGEVGLVVDDGLTVRNNEPVPEETNDGSAWLQFAQEHRRHIDPPSGSPFKREAPPTEFDDDLLEMGEIDGTRPKAKPRDTPTLDELVAMFGVRGGQ
jgi:hypothetical protein